MSEIVGKLSVEIGADTSGLEKGLARARAGAALFGEAVSKSVPLDAFERVGDMARLAGEAVTAAANGMRAKLAEAGLLRAGAEAISRMATAAAANGALAAAFSNQGFLAGAAMDGALAAADFYGKGNGVIRQMTAGLADAGGALVAAAQGIAARVSAALSISAGVSAAGGRVRVSASVPGYDSGGYFDRPQIIGIAEKRPEFVGAAQDLRSFINGAVAAAFRVGCGENVMRGVGAPVPSAIYGGATTIEVHNTFAPREMSRAQMDYQSYKIQRDIQRVARL